MLKSKLEKLKQEKESNQLKIENFENAYKSLEKLIGSQITDKSRKGVGFIRYNAVPPPPTGLFSPSKFDLSNSGLEEFQQPEFKGNGPKTSKSVSEDISNEVRETPDAPLAKELKSDDNLEKKTLTANYNQREEWYMGIIIRTEEKYWYRMLVMMNHNLLVMLKRRMMKGPENSTQDIKTAGPSINTASTNVNTGSININIVSPTVTTAPLEATHANFFGDEIEIDMSNITTTYLFPSTPNTRIDKGHSLDHVIGDVQFSVQTRRMTKTTNEQGFISAVYEGKTYEDLHTCLSSYNRFRPWWIYHMAKEPLVLNGCTGTRKIRGIVIRNKARLVAHGHTQEDGINYDEMDVKSAFLYDKIEEEVYVCQPPGSKDSEFPDRVYKVENELYDLHQAPRAWYETLSTYLLDNGFQRGLQVTQKDDGIFISQDKYVDEILKKFGFSTVKTTSTPMETSKPLMKDENAEDVDVHLYRSMIGSLMYLTSSRPDIIFVDSPFDLEAYTDSDYAGASLDRKSTTRGCQFLRSRLISWQCKKQTVVANSTTEAEYVAAASCCGQVLWIQNQMLDYGYNFMNTKIFIDNESTICIVNNPVFHSKTKHIEIKHHFIRDSNEKKLIQMIKIHTDQNVADLLTKAFDVGRFQYLIASIGMLNL
ncbi:putative ribonuclease H-like domain-containing protein [Tanacetum coccineum]